MANDTVPPAEQPVTMTELISELQKAAMWRLFTALCLGIAAVMSGASLVTFFVTNDHPSVTEAILMAVGLWGAVFLAWLACATWTDYRKVSTAFEEHVRISIRDGLAQNPVPTTNTPPPPPPTN